MKKFIGNAIIFLACIVFTTQGDTRPELDNLKTGSLDQQITAMYYFGYSKNKGSFWFLVKNLTKTFGDQDDGVWGERFRQVAAESLGRLGDDRAVPFLIKQYKEEKKESVKKSIIFSLGFFKSKDVVPILNDALKSDKRELLVEAIQASATCGDASVVPGIKALGDKNEDKALGVLSAYALIRLGDEPDKNAAILTKELINGDPAIRFWSAYCLSQTDRVEAVDDLIKALEIENYPWVKKEMEAALILLAKKKKESD